MVLAGLDRKATNMYGTSAYELQRRQHRVRIQEATLGITAIGGYQALSVAAIIEVAGVSRRVFRRCFANPDAVLLEIHGSCVDELAARVAAADIANGTTRERLEACLTAIVGYLVDDPVRAETLVVGAHGAGASVLQVQEAALSALTVRVAGMLVADGVGAVDADRGARLGIGAVRETLRTRIVRGELDELEPLVPELVSAAFPMVARDHALAA